MLFPSEPFSLLCTLAFGISQALVRLRPPAQLMEWSGKVTGGHSAQLTADVAQQCGWGEGWTLCFRG